VSAKTHRRTANWRVSGADRPEWSFFADDEQSAELTAKTFTRWDLEHRGKTGEFTIELANIKTGAVREVRVAVGMKPARQQSDPALAEAA